MLWRLKLMRYRRRRAFEPWRRTRRLAFVLRWGLRLLLLLLIADLVYLAYHWPDWSQVARGPVPRSNFIRAYEMERRHDATLPRLRWRPVSLARIPRHVQRAVIVAEDSRFYQHGGFDLIAFKEAMDFNLDKGRFAFGASTISQQTVKNLFLSASRNPLRKWHELLLTWGMEHRLRKSRILELYLNIAEFGRGIYGVQAAARAYWGRSADELDLQQAAELAATLPSPRKHNPATRSKPFLRRTDKILYWLRSTEGGARSQAVNRGTGGEAGARRRLSALAGGIS